MSAKKIGWRRSLTVVDTKKYSVRSDNAHYGKTRAYLSQRGLKMFVVRGLFGCLYSFHGNAQSMKAEKKTI